MNTVKPGIIQQLCQCTKQKLVCCPVNHKCTQKCNNLTVLANLLTDVITSGETNDLLWKSLCHQF